MGKLFLLDAYAIIFRSYYAFLKRPTINSKGLNTSPVLGFCNTLKEILDKESPDYIGVAFDKGKTFRHEAFPALQGPTARDTRGHKTLGAYHTRRSESYGHTHPHCRGL